MKETIRKLLSLVLVCTMLTGLGTVFTVFADSDFVISLTANGVKVPIGMKVEVKAASLPSDAATLEVYDASGAKVGEAIVSDAAAAAKCTVVNEMNLFTAKALNASGDVVAASNTVAVKGYCEKIAETRWDVDFSSHAVAEHYSWKVPWYQIVDDKGAAVKSSNDTLVCHTGNTDNKITITDTGDAKYGNAMQLVANSGGEVQLNQFYARSIGDVIKYEIDYKLISLPTSVDGNTNIKVIQPQLNNNAWLTQVALLANGSEVSFSCANATMPASVGAWYNVEVYADVLNCKAHYYINDCYFTSVSFASGATGGTKVVSALKNAQGASCYIDNFKVETVNLVYEKEQEVRWDIDFSSYALAEHYSWKVPWYQIVDDKGAAVKSSNDTLVCHTGNTDNKITITDTGEAEYGNALQMIAKDNAEVQLNQFYARSIGDVIKYEIDYKLVSLPTVVDSNTNIKVIQPQLNNNAWLTQVALLANGSEVSFSCANATMPASVGTWYNVEVYADVVNSKAHYYINDCYFTSVSFASGATGGTKVVSALKNAQGASCYIDNFKVSTVSFEEPVLALKSVEYIIDGETAISPKAGSLSIAPVITNDGQVRSVKLYVAVYSSAKELEYVKICGHSFAAGETQYAPDAFEITTLKDGETVKTMLWHATNDVIPVDEPSTLE